MGARNLNNGAKKMINKILEEAGKSFGRQLAEAILAQSLSTLVNGAIEAGIEIVKTKKLIEMSKKCDISSPEQQIFSVQYVQESEAVEEQHDEEDQEKEPEPEPKPKRKKRKKD